ncbi:DNA ligase 4-like [Uranotaenia lowii]|uniref:DNA ligase 4-like n=1 Tax=Uranotaenia lowii TaxID=190385 RepID=UPI0024787CC7|nr:DNA ligase 4-like [Uranotaenia lowii]
MSSTEPVQCISQHVKFAEISAILEKLKSATGPASRKDDILRRYFDSFEQFRREFRQKHGDNVKSSIFPVLRLLVPASDRERESYGIRIKSLKDLYIKVLGISESSIEAKKLSGFDESGNFFGGSSGSSDFAERVFTLMRGRCPQECRVTVWDVNERLDAIGEHYRNGRKGKILDELIRMVEGMTQLDQKWLIRIILKNLRLGMTKQKLLGLYHPKASQLFDRFSNLSKVCEVVESGEVSDEAEVPTKKLAIQIFHPVKAMLCQRVDLRAVDEMLQKEEFWLETKMDGERFQIHKEGQIFKYFSRNSYEYSHVFGENPNHSGSTLTPYISSLIEPSVQSIILDGEMMVFDKTDLAYRDKSENTDVKALKSDNPNLRPCFCVYDILFLNGRSLIGIPYAERIRLLKTAIKEKIGVLVSCRRIKVNDSDHLVDLLNEAIDARQEGVVIKKQDSVYSPNERNAGWYKIKPDYIDNLVSDFDLLIIGGFYNYKRTFVNTFLVGVLEKRLANDDEQPTYLGVTKVGIGLSLEQWKQLNNSLRPHWQEVVRRKEGRSTIAEEPPGVRWGQTAPDVWISGSNSIVLQLKGSELVRSSSFATAYTIRFPRITAIRSDKGHLDVCTKEEFDQLCSSNSKVAKLAKRHITSADLLPSSTSTRGKRKKISPLNLKRNKPILPEIGITVTEDQPPIDHICEGLDFCVLTSVKDFPAVPDLERLVRRHGGRPVKNPGPKTYAVIVGDRSFLADRIINSGLYNVASVRWLLEALSGDQPKDRLIEFKPNDMLAMTVDLRRKLIDRFDRFGDSLTEKIVDQDDLKQLLKQISLNGAQLSVGEIRDGQREILGPSSTFRIFRGSVGILYEDNLREDLDRYRAKFAMLRFVREGGQWLKDAKDRGVSHVFVAQGKHLEKDQLKQWVDSLTKGRILAPVVVKLEWIGHCLQRRQACDEQTFNVL